MVHFSSVGLFSLFFSPILSQSVGDIFSGVFLVRFANQFDDANWHLSLYFYSHH